MSKGYFNRTDQIYYTLTSGIMYASNRAINWPNSLWRHGLYDMGDKIDTSPLASPLDNRLLTNENLKSLTIFVFPFSV